MTQDTGPIAILKQTMAEGNEVQITIETRDDAEMVVEFLTNAIKHLDDTGRHSQKLFMRVHRRPRISYKYLIMTLVFGIAMTIYLFTR